MSNVQNNDESGRPLPTLSELTDVAVWLAWVAWVLSLAGDAHIITNQGTLAAKGT